MHGIPLNTEETVEQPKQKHKKQKKLTSYELDPTSLYQIDPSLLKFINEK